MRNLTLLLIVVCLNNNVYGNAFSMGDGNHWIEMCTGKNSTYPGQIGKDICHLTMLSYQIGALTQALEFEREPTLCRDIPEDELTAEFIEYIEKEDSRKSADFLELFPEYLRSEDACKI